MNTTVSGLPLGLFLRVHCGSGGNADVERQPQTRTQNKGTTRERLNLAHPSTDTWKHFPSIFTPRAPESTSLLVDGALNTERARPPDLVSLVAGEGAKPSPARRLRTERRGSPSHYGGRVTPDPGEDTRRRRRLHRRHYRPGTQIYDKCAASTRWARQAVSLSRCTMGLSEDMPTRLGRLSTLPPLPRAGEGRPPCQCQARCRKFYLESRNNTRANNGPPLGPFDPESKSAFSTPSTPTPPTGPPTSRTTRSPSCAPARPPPSPS